MYESYLSAVRKNIPDAIRHYRKKLERITANLQADVQAQLRAEAQREFFDKIAASLRVVKAHCAAFAAERQALLDPQTRLLRLAVEQSASLTPGDVLLAQTFTALPMEQLQILAGMLVKPGLLLALQAVVQQREFADKKVKVALLQQIAATLPMATADKERCRELANLELSGLKIELAVVFACDGEELSKHSLSRKIAALEKILSGAAGFGDDL